MVESVGPQPFEKLCSQYRDYLSDGSKAINHLSRNNWNSEKGTCEGCLKAITAYRHFFARVHEIDILQLQIAADVQQGSKIPILAISSKTNHMSFSLKLPREAPTMGHSKLQEQPVILLSTSTKLLETCGMESTVPYFSGNRSRCRNAWRPKLRLGNEQWMPLYFNGWCSNVGWENQDLICCCGKWIYDLWSGNLGIDTCGELVWLLYPWPKIRDHSDRLLDHPGRVQGWESVCWGVLGIPLLENKKVQHASLTLIFILCFCNVICYVLRCSFLWCLNYLSFAFRTFQYIRVRAFWNVRFPDLQNSYFSKIRP